jgi:hypothetical protein
MIGIILHHISVPIQTKKQEGASSVWMVQWLRRLWAFFVDSMDKGIPMVSKISIN